MVKTTKENKKVLFEVNCNYNMVLHKIIPMNIITMSRQDSQKYRHTERNCERTERQRIQRRRNVEKRGDRDVYSERQRWDGQETHPAGRGSGNAGGWPECRDKERE